MSNKANEVFDFSDYETTFAEGAEGSRDKSEKFVPQSGPVGLEVVKSGRATTKNGEPKIWTSLRMTDGKFSGETVFKSWLIRKDATSLRYMMNDFKTMGKTGIEKLDDLNDDAKLNSDNGNRLAGSIEVTDTTKGFYNVKINKRIVETV